MLLLWAVIRQCVRESLDGDLWDDISIWVGDLEIARIELHAVEGRDRGGALLVAELDEGKGRPRAARCAAAT